MYAPSQSKERLRQAIHTINSLPPPHVLPSEINPPILEPASFKDSYSQILIVVLAIIGLLIVVFAAIAWKLNGI